MIALVRQAAEEAEKTIRPGIPSSEPSRIVNSLFSSHGYTMPHSLGHGIGLDVHEEPLLKANQANPGTLKKGMIIAVEPGLYDPAWGGVRLENDFIITDTGCEKITSSRIISLDCPEDRHASRKHR